MNATYRIRFINGSETLVTAVYRVDFHDEWSSFVHFAQGEVFACPATSVICVEQVNHK